MPLCIPSWASELGAVGWANIYDLVVQPGRLTGVDSLCGDVNAHTLVVGKDFAPAKYVRDRIARGEADPYRHNPKVHTNRMLCALLGRAGIEVAIDGSTANKCGVYYANAHYLLRDDDAWSGGLPNARAAQAEGARMLAHIITSLPRLERIIAMGSEAYQALAEPFGLATPWRTALEHRKHAARNGIRIFASSHLGSRGVTMRIPGAARHISIAAIQKDWLHAFD